MPSSPRSPAEFTETVMKGVVNSAPFFTTRRRPACSVMKMRPSGATAIAVGLGIPLAIIDSTMPVGNTAVDGAPPGSASRGATSVGLGNESRLHVSDNSTATAPSAALVAALAVKRFIVYPLAQRFV